MKFISEQLNRIISGVKVWHLLIALVWIQVAGAVMTICFPLGIFMDGAALIVGLMLVIQNR